MQRRTFVAIITGATLYAAALRLYELPSAGAVYMDDLRAYSGTAVIEALTRPDVSIKERIGFAYRASIDETGARPALAWLAAIPAALGFDRLGDLYLPCSPRRRSHSSDCLGSGWSMRRPAPSRPSGSPRRPDT
jgi:hypothetical protein